MSLFSGCRGQAASINSVYLQDTTSTTANTTKANTTVNTTINTNSNTISFNTKTLDDEAITSDIFKDYDITMINFWATWCYYCIQEMPDLSKLYDELPEGSNLIGIAIDAGDDESTKQNALNIISTYNIKYKNIIPDVNIANYVNKNITGIPISIFVDKDGNIIGDPLIGAPRGDVVEGYKKAIEDRISLVNKS